MGAGGGGGPEGEAASRVLFQGDDGEIGPRGLPGESVSVGGTGSVAPMPEEGRGHERDALSPTRVPSSPHLNAGTSRSPWPQRPSWDSWTPGE